MIGHACYSLGVVEEGDTISVTNGDTPLISTSMSTLRKAWKETLDGGGPQ